MGQEGYGITMIVFGLVLLPLFFMFGGVGGIIIEVIIFGFFLIKHAKIYYSSPSVIMKNIDTNIYDFGREYVNSHPNRKLTYEEIKYNNIRCMIYEIAYQTSLKYKRNYIDKYDYKVAADSVPGVYVNDYGVYCINYKANRIKEDIYLIVFPKDFRNKDPRLGKYSKRFRVLYK